MNRPSLDSREKQLRYLVVGANGKVNQAHPSAREYELLVELRKTREELARQQELWTLQSGVIRALAPEVPDEVRSRVLAPLAEVPRFNRRQRYSILRRHGHTRLYAWRIAGQMAALDRAVSR